LEIDIDWGADGEERELASVFSKNPSRTQCSTGGVGKYSNILAGFFPGMNGRGLLYLLDVTFGVN